MFFYLKKMLEKKRKTVLKMLVAALVVAGVLIYISWPKQTGILEVNYLDIGQGDSILIQTSYNQDILIDGGPDMSVLDEIGQQLPFYDHDIEIMVLTHAHADHVIGLIEVMERYDVDQIFYSGEVADYSPGFVEFLRLSGEKNIPRKAVIAGEEYILGGDLVLEILYPPKDLSGQAFENLNNTSVAMRLVFGQTEFILTGDAEIEEEHEIINIGHDLKSDVLKAGHHGSKTASSADFLDKVQPQIAVIQSGEGNSFGHPHFKTLLAFERRGVKVFRNDLCGTIMVKSDGENIDVKSERCE